MPRAGLVQVWAPDSHLPGQHSRRPAKGRTYMYPYVVYSTSETTLDEIPLVHIFPFKELLDVYVPLDRVILQRSQRSNFSSQ